MNRFAELDRRYVWHPFTQMRDWLEAEPILITGIGSSWHAGMAVEALFHAGGRSVALVDASELLHFTRIPPGAAIVGRPGPIQLATGPGGPAAAGVEVARSIRSKSLMPIPPLCCQHRGELEPRQAWKYVE